jgi:hypothetical protein
MQGMLQGALLHKGWHDTANSAAQHAEAECIDVVARTCGAQTEPRTFNTA